MPLGFTQIRCPAFTIGEHMNSSSAIRFRFLICLLIAGLGINVCLAQETPQVADADAKVVEIASQAKPSIVRIGIIGRDGTEEGIGTGFIVSEDGLIATNLHVIAEARPIKVELNDGSKFDVTEIHAFDRDLDLALLRIDAHGKELSPLKLGDSDKVLDGQSVVAIGHPHGLRDSIVKGLISGKREIEDRPMFQIAMPIEPGNSGGPLLNMQGEVIGIVTMKSAVTENLGFAMDIKQLQHLLDKPNPTEISKWLTIGALDAAHWQPKFGANWRQRSGRIMVEGFGEGVGGRSLCINQCELPEMPFEVAVQVKLDDESGAAGLIFGCDDHDLHYGFYPSAGEIRLSRFDGPSVYDWRVLRQLPCEAYRPGEWNYLKVRFEKDRFVCFVNDVEVTQFKHDHDIQGKLGLAKFRETIAEYKNFRVAREIPKSEIPADVAAKLNSLIRDLPDLAKSTGKQLSALEDEAENATLLLSKNAEDLEKRALQLRRYAQDLHVQSIANQTKMLFAEDAAENDHRLLEATLLICKLNDPDIVLSGYTEQVQQWAASLKEQAGEIKDPFARLEKLNDFMFRQHGFHGCRINFHHPANSFICHVIDDREGLPITLAILYMELGKAIDLDLRGINLPGRFVVRFDSAGQKEDADKNQDTKETADEIAAKVKFIDVFEGGKILNRIDLAKLVVNSTGRSWDDSLIEEANDKGIYLRVLQNLFGNAERLQDHEAQLKYVNLILALDPDSVSNRGLRAVLKMQTGRKAGAIEDLDWIIEKNPPELDIERVYEMRAAFLRAK